MEMPYTMDEAVPRGMAAPSDMRDSIRRGRSAGGCQRQHRRAEVRMHAVVDRVVLRIVVHDQVPVERVALCGNPPGTTDELDQLGAVAAMPGAGARDDVLLEHHGAEIVRAEVQ